MLNRFYSTPKISTFGLFFFFLFIINGLTPTAFATTYTATPYGSGTGQGIIVSTRTIPKEGWKEGTIVATLVGAGIGGGLGALIGNGVGQIAAIIGGAVLGGSAGGAITAGTISQDMVEYVVRLKNEEVITVMQEKDPALLVGQRVLVSRDIQGKSIIVIDNTRYIQPETTYTPKKIKPLPKR